MVELNPNVLVRDDITMVGHSVRTHLPYKGTRQSNQYRPLGVKLKNQVLVLRNSRKSCENPKKLLRKSSEIAKKVLRKLLESPQNVSPNLLESPERVLRKYLESPQRVLTES